MADNKSNEKEARRRKHQKKMTKIVAKAWALDRSDPFQESHHRSTDKAVYDLTTIGQHLDDGVYTFDRPGWEHFARDIGGVYNRHILKKGKYAKVATQHLEQVLQWLEKVNPVLVKTAKDHAPPAPHHGKKRKSDADHHHNGSAKKKQDKKPDKPLTLSEREDKAMESLGNYVEEHGGDRSQVASFHCKTTKRSDGRCENTFYNSEGKRFRNMVDVARFLGLVEDTKAKKKTKPKPAKKKKQLTSRDIENEKRKLRRELDKLHRAHVKATKALDDFTTERNESRYPVDDDVLMQEDAGVRSVVTRAACPAARIPDMDGFPGIPAHCTPDLLMVWDFLCTFSRALSLNSMPLDDFVAALTYAPGRTNDDDMEISPPVMLAEAHLGLLRLILNDASSEDWWWSTLETDEAAVAAAAADGDFGDATASNTQGESDMPVIRIDMEALLAEEEDPLITASWLQSLSDVRNHSTSDAGPIRNAVKSALSFVSNKWVKAYLKTAIRKGKGNSVSFTKRAVLWLVDRVRDARPDLFGRNVSKETVLQHRAKVVDTAAIAMEKLHDSIEPVTLEDVEGDSDEDSDDSDDDDEDDVSKGNHSSHVDGNTQDEAERPVRSAIPVNPPPSLVDLLLPPSKPKPSSDIVSPFTWPFIAGASASRVLHRYKRRRNEVDDSIREFNELPPMSMGERRSREAVAPARILTECVAKEGETSPLEKAIDHLCTGGTYLSLSAVERLCLFRLLIEAAYDTDRVYEVVNENFKSRINALKALEMEERRAKREAKEESAAAETAARAQLADEARAKFIQEKREEIHKSNLETNEYTPEVLAALTDEEVVEFDEETKAEYDSLPGPESFNKTEVNKMVARMQQEAAFGTHSLLVLKMDEIQKRDKDELQAMEKELAAFGDTLENRLLDRETSKSIDRLRKNIESAKDLAESLPEVRESAVETLQDAIEDGTIKVLRAAIRMAKQAKLTGPDRGTDGLWALDLLRDAALELKTAESRKRVTDAQKDLVAKRNKCFIRTEPLGRDRFRNRFWHFDADLTGRVWAEVDYILKKGGDLENGGGSGSDYVDLMIEGGSLGICEEDKSVDLKRANVAPSNEQFEKFTSFSGQEYHPSGSICALAKRYWGAHITEKSFRSMIKNLDKRGSRENELRTNLKTTLEDSGLSASAGQDEKASGNDDATDEYRTTGDEQVCGAARDSLSQSSSIDLSLLEGVSSALGKRIRVREVLDPAKVPILANYTMATVVGWKMHTEVDDDATDRDDSESSSSAANAETPKGTPVPVWRVLYDTGEDVLLQGSEVVESLCRAIQWQAGHAKENDGGFLAYRNSLGRYCGRAADAALASSPMALARLMVKREQELYTRIKNRTFDNNWGGKSGARNIWISTMREYCFEIGTVRNGLVTLESAFFELTGGFAAVEENGMPTVVRTARELLNDDSARFEIELESLIKQARCLWNSPESRSIFLEIVESSSTIGMLALAFDLLCRNCWVYLNANTVAEDRKKPVAATTTTRRMNAWQQANQSLYY